MGDVQVGSADGHARHGRVSRARWSRAPPGAAQSAAPFWSLLFPKSRFSQGRYQTPLKPPYDAVQNQK
eukprot:4458544-Prymnesium_polylepis.1